MTYRTETISKLIAKYIGFGVSDELDNLSLKDLQDKLENSHEPFIELISMPEFSKLEEYELYEIERIMDYDFFTYNLKDLKNMIVNDNMCDIYCLPFAFIEFLLKHHFDIFGLIERGYAKAKTFNL